MPTKLGKGGAGQQNYVPKGNGDASGEYGNNATGSNKHFTSFKKPSRSNELSKKQIKEIGEYVKSRMDNYTNDKMIQLLRYYSGSFGNLSGFTDQELSDIVDEFKELKTGDWVWYKKGSKWEKTNEIGLLEKAGIPYYTKEEKEELERKENEKLIESSQTEQDKKIQNIMGEKCLVCFGKGYSKEEVNNIAKDIKTITDDFPELKNDIKMIGDRNNLEKLINARKQSQELTEEQIQNEINRIKKYTTYYNLQGEKLEQKYREEAIKRLKAPIKLDKLNKALAYWSPSISGLIYMGKMKNWDNSNSEHSFDVNWHSSNKTNGVMCHELGHSIHTSLEKLYQKKSEELANDWERLFELKRNYQTFSENIRELEKQNYNKDYRSEYDKLFEEKYGKPRNDNYWDRKKYEVTQEVEQELKNKGIKKYNVSEYATTNIKEFIAESFSAYYTNMKNSLADKVVNEFKNMFKKIREA